MLISFKSCKSLGSPWFSSMMVDIFPLAHSGLTVRVGLLSALGCSRRCSFPSPQHPPPPCFFDPFVLPEGSCLQQQQIFFQAPSIQWVKGKQGRGLPALGVFSLHPAAVSVTGLCCHQHTLVVLGSTAKASKPPDSQAFCCLINALPGVMKPLFSSSRSKHKLKTVRFSPLCQVQGLWVCKVPAFPFPPTGSAHKQRFFFPADSL